MSFLITFIVFSRFIYTVMLILISDRNRSVNGGQNEALAYAKDLAKQYNCFLADRKIDEAALAKQITRDEFRRLTELCERILFHK